MADQARDDFAQVMLTMEGRIRRLPQADREAVNEVGRGYDRQRAQLVQVQARSRAQEIAAKRTELLRETPRPELKPSWIGPDRSYSQRTRNIDRAAAKAVDDRNDQALKELDKRKSQDIEKRVTAAEQAQERKRADDLAKAAEMARQFQQNSRAHGRSR